MEDGSPLILNSRAAWRLRWLQLPAAQPGNGSTAPGVPRAITRGTLAAALLPELVAAHSSSASDGWAQQRDPQHELAATVPTLQRLQLPAGAVVQVCNPACPDLPPRLARILAAPGSAEAAGPPAFRDSVAYLAPSLAFNLGLALHLWPLLHTPASKEEGQAGLAGSPALVAVRRYSPPGARHEPAGLAEQQQQQQLWHQLAQPGGEAASVPVASQVHIAVVRLPQAAVLQQRQARGGAAAGGEGDSAADGEADAADNGNGASGAAVGASAGGSGDRQSGESAPQSASDDAVATLQQWFLEAPRVVTEGDVLAVPRQRNGAGGWHDSLAPLLLPNLHSGVAGAADAAAAPELLYFKVAKLVLAEQVQAAACSSAAVVVGSTAVKLVGSCSSALPVGLPHYLAGAAAAPGAGYASGGHGSSAGARLVLGAHATAADGPAPVLPPAGPLLPAWRPLAQLLVLALHPGAAGVPLRLAVLLHGPAGCGKLTAAAAAAAATGCHLVSLSCHDVKAGAGAAERHTFEGVRAAFAAAADYAPAVLLLRHFSALGDGSTHGGSGSTSAQSYTARLGSVLSDCIHRHTAGSTGTASSGPSVARQGEPALPASAPVVLIACTTSADDLPAPLRRCFTHEVGVEAPDQQQRQQLLLGGLGGVPARPDWQEDAGLGSQAGVQAAAAGAIAAGAGGGPGAVVSGDLLEEAALHTAGLLPRELRAVAADAAAAAALQALPPAAVVQAAEGGAIGAGTAPADRGSEAQHSGSADSSQSAAAADATPPVMLSPEHLASAVDAVRQRTATDIGAPKIPSVKWEDVGGLQDIKRAILDTVELPLKHPELFAGGLRRRSGVLLYGPPGTGKTLLAKAVATECSISFLSVKGPELINMYVGESERQIREVFARARRARPCVVFFDELDSLAPARGRGSDSGGVMDRVVSQLLAEIDGVQGGGAGDVFLVGATNRPDLLDTALLRPGRLDKLLYVGIAKDVASRVQVLQALTRRFRVAPGVDMGQVAARCADRFTGADLYALCSDAWMTALKRSIARLEERQQQPTAIESGHAESGGAAPPPEPEADEQVEVTQADFLSAADTLQPSLSADEVAKYERIRDQYQQQGDRQR